MEEVEALPGFLRRRGGVGGSTRLWSGNFLEARTRNDAGTPDANSPDAQYSWAGHRAAAGGTWRTGARLGKFFRRHARLFAHKTFAAPRGESPVPLHALGHAGSAHARLPTTRPRAASQLERTRGPPMGRELSRGTTRS